MSSRDGDTDHREREPLWIFERQYSRQDLLRGATAAVAFSGLSGVLAACGGDEQSASPATSDFTPSGSVTFWNHDFPTYTEPLRSLAAEYTATYDVAVEHTEIPYEQFETKVITAASGGSGPDIYKIGSWSFANLASKGLIAPVDLGAVGVASLEDLEARYDPGVLEGFTYEGELYGLPVDLNNQLLWYRRDLFEEAGLDPDSPPATWEELIDYAAKLTTRDSSGKTTRAGFLWWYGVPIFDVLYMISIVEAFGASFLKDDSGGLNTPEGIEAIQFYADLSLKHRVSDPTLSDPLGPNGLLARGRAAMTINGAWVQSEVESVNREMELGNTYDVAPHPRFAFEQEPVVGGYSWGYAVNANSDNQQTAWHFTNHLQSPDAASRILQASTFVTPIAEWKDLSGAENEGIQLMADQVPAMDYGPALPQWNEFAKALDDALQSVVVGNATAADAAERYDQAIARAVKS